MLESNFVLYMFEVKTAKISLDLQKDADADIQC